MLMYRIIYLFLQLIVILLSLRYVWKKYKLSSNLEKYFLWQYYVVELDSMVLDVTKEELSPFNKYLLKHLSFSNAVSIWQSHLLLPVQYCL